MKKPLYNHRDRILWILAQKSGSATRTELCRSIEIKLENMERILMSWRSKAGLRGPLASMGN